MRGRVIKVLLTVGMLATLPGCMRACQWAGEAEQVAYEQVRPRELLRKYEWFKDQAAALDAKVAQIAALRARLARAEGRGNEVALTQAETELVGVVAKYNSMAGEYNAAMAKANWAFCEVGRLPPGATTPLPREFKPYLEQ